MIIGTDSRYKIGETIQIYLMVQSGNDLADMRHPVTCTIGRIATKAEYLEGLMQRFDPEVVKRVFDEHGEPPSHYNYYEIAD